MNLVSPADPEYQAIGWDWGNNDIFGIAQQVKEWDRKSYLVPNHASGYFEVWRHTPEGDFVLLLTCMEADGTPRLPDQRDINTLRERDAFRRGQLSVTERKELVRKQLQKEEELRKEAFQEMMKEAARKIEIATGHHTSFASMSSAGRRHRINRRGR